MATTEKKNQHYVPKMLLRRFSWQSNQRQVGLFNTVSQLFIEKAPLKTQASSPFFYGKDGSIEDFLGEEIEGPAAIGFKRIVEESYLPPQRSAEYAPLLKFVIASILRTPHMVERINTSFDRLIRTVYGEVESVKQLLETHEFTLKEPTRLALQNLRRGALFCADLTPAILRNTTTTPFIIGDNPVIKYNQFMESKGWQGGTTGFSSLGLQLILPFDPHTALILYDPWAYKVGSRSSKIISITQVTDIEQINRLTFLHCTNQVYFNHELNKQQLQSLFERASRYNKADLVLQKRYEQAGRTGEFLIQDSHLAAKTNLKLSFINFTKQAKKHTLDSKVAQVRPSHHNVKQLIDYLNINE